MEAITIARPYAQAVFATARAHQTLSQWSDALAVLAHIASDKRMMALNYHPKLGQQDLVNFYTHVAGEALAEPVVHLLFLLAENRRLGFLPLIYQVFSDLKNQEDGQQTVDVFSANPLTDAQKEKLSAALQRRCQKTLLLRCQEQPDLLGGVVLKIGDRVIDGSLRGRLQQLAENLKS